MERVILLIAAASLAFGCGDDADPMGMPDADPMGMPDADPMGMPDADPMGMPDADPMGMPDAAPMMDATVEPDAMAMMDGSAGAVSWSRDILPALRANCGDCHTNRTRGNLSWGTSSTTADRAYGTLVGPTGMGINAMGGSCSSRTTVRVDPGNASASLLYQKVVGTHDCGNPMPPRGTYPAAATRELETWINEGAMNN